jgi:hypothetical protein
MRQPAARWRRDEATLTRQPRPARHSETGGRPAPETREGQMVRRGHDTLTASAVGEDRSHRLERRIPLPHARQDRQASSVSRPLEGRQRPKKPGPSLLQVASPVGRGAPVFSGCRSFRGWLTGLLSRSPPTDTRPQARAYWANVYLGESFPNARDFLARGDIFGPRHRRRRSSSVVGAARGLSSARNRAVWKHSNLCEFT